MNFPVQFSPGGTWNRWRLCGVAAAAIALFLCAWPARAQNPPPSPIARVEGTDVSVQGPSTPGNDNESKTPSILVGNGSVVTVHAGDARMMFARGGHVDICGPAKFTMLESAGAITLALDFGRIRVQVPASVKLRLFTPRIVATPIDISGGTRDITVGLDRDESLCVLAASGAIQLEHQFSGEKLIVPQDGEFFLNSGQLLPVAGSPGSCQCSAMQPPPPAPAQPPEFAGNVAPASAQPAPASAPATAANPPAVEFNVPAHANEEHPLPAAPKNSAPPAAPPVYTIAAPLSFTAGTPTSAADQPIDTALLIREAQVQPVWQFQGHIDPPDFATAMQHALGEGTVPSEPSAQPAAEPQKKRARIWRLLRKIL